MFFGEVSGSGYEERFLILFGGLIGFFGVFYVSFVWLEVFCRDSLVIFKVVLLVCFL